MKITIKLLFAIAAFMFISQASFAQTKSPKPRKEITVKSKTVEKSRGSNTNIKVDMPKTDAKVDKSKSRGGGYGDCWVYVNNHSDYTTHVYIDGEYSGTLSPWSSGYMLTGDGYTTFYAISAGGTAEWIMDGNCDYEYTFTMTN